MKGKLRKNWQNTVWHLLIQNTALILVGGFGTRLRPLVRLPLCQQIHTLEYLIAYTLHIVDEFYN
jgi:hypothetical protein